MRPKDVEGVAPQLPMTVSSPSGLLTLPGSHRGNKDPAVVLVSDTLTENEGNIFIWASANANADANANANAKV